ncbi:hypothetical protein SOVF_170320 [Spinacia oleracea]|uniref:Glycosyltransferase n=1 Tax=Spinacia oleracea TaxID=3562 RepID=A0A9R0I193_SPIOL|nr:soyasapogenol B glucuronide galactosyltransferase-like [Spinacia oleracea]KNA07606.1 hypothetical protein SOVF_170320 [Spinacia oleracea]
MELSNPTTTPTLNATQPLRGYFIPLITVPSHISNLVDIAKLFSSRGVHVTILTTHHTSLRFKQSIHDWGFKIDLHIVDFPFREVGLPEGVENYSDATPEQASQLFQAFMMLQKPMEDAIRAAKPDFIVSDRYYHWSTDLARELAIPRLIFHVRCYFALCAAEVVAKFAPHEKVESDTDLFFLPDLPDTIHMTRLQLPEWIQTRNMFTVLNERMDEADRECYGVIVNSCYELERAYADFYRSNLGRRAWCIGPYPVHCDKVGKKKGDDSKKHSCFEWLDKMGEGEVIYVSFGTLSCFSPAQISELATALEMSGHPFIWVVRNGEKLLPDGFEERITEQDKGVLIKDWAPQVKILEHPAVGGFLTHCGWNSTVESLAAGVPMVTWPLGAEQFFNEKLISGVLKVGVEVGSEKWSRGIVPNTDMIEKDKIERAIKELMSKEPEAEERRQKVKELSKAPRNAVEEGGSSRNNLSDLIEKLQRLKANEISVSTNSE